MEPVSSRNSPVPSVRSGRSPVACSVQRGASLGQGHHGGLGTAEAGGGVLSPTRPSPRTQTTVPLWAVAGGGGGEWGLCMDLTPEFSNEFCKGYSSSLWKTERGENWFIEELIPEGIELSPPGVWLGTPGCRHSPDGPTVSLGPLHRLSCPDPCELQTCNPGAAWQPLLRGHRVSTSRSPHWVFSCRLNSCGG